MNLTFSVNYKPQLGEVQLFRRKKTEHLQSGIGGNFVAGEEIIILASKRALWVVLQFIQSYGLAVHDGSLAQDPPPGLILEHFSSYFLDI